MRQSKIPFNIYDLNFILTFAGFAIFTSISNSIPSILYRALALAVAILCIIISPSSRSKYPIVTQMLLWLMILLDLKTAFHLLFEAQSFIESRNLAILFIFGVTLIPVYAFLVGFNKIHWKSTLVILEVLLFITIIKGYTSSLSETDFMRMALNERQSTLAFGDNSCYLFILSICLLKDSVVSGSDMKRWLWRFFLIVAIIISVLGMARAASRGPVVAAVVGLFFILFSSKLNNQIKFIAIALLIIIYGGVSPQTLEKVAPVLYSRMSNTILEGDSSGRDILFATAVNQIENHPVLGTNPIILGEGGFTSCHNGYLVVGVGLGVLGFVFYVSFVLWLLLTLFRHRYDNFNYAHMFIATMAFVTSTRAMTGFDLMSNPDYSMCILAATILASSYSKSAKGILNI